MLVKGTPGGASMTPWNESPFDQGMAYPWKGDQPLPEPLLTDKKHGPLKLKTKDKSILSMCLNMLFAKWPSFCPYVIYQVMFVSYDYLKDFMAYPQMKPIMKVGNISQSTCVFPELEQELTHCGLVTPYGSRDLGQHWFRYWLVAWRHQAITWTNVDLSSLWSSDVHLRAISLEISQPSATKINLKIIFLWFYWNLPGANELTYCCHTLRPYGVTELVKHWLW